MPLFYLASLSGHVSCASCVVDSEKEGWIECAMCQEAFYNTFHALGDSEPRAPQILVEPADNANLQAQITALKRGLEDEKRSRKDFESDLLRQLLKISIKEENDQREVETLRTEVNIMKNAISTYIQELDEARNKFAGIERKCATLENEMKADKARGDEEISRLQEASKQERRRSDTRNSDGVPARYTSREVKTEEGSQAIDPPRTAPRGARAPAPAIKTEESQATPRLVVRGIAVESRQAVVADGRRGRVFKPVAPVKGTNFDTDTTTTDTDTDAEAVIDAKPPSERPVLTLPARKTPRVNLPASVLQDKATSVPTPPAPKKRELKRGADIKWKGYGCPQNTAVPECTDQSGVHNFSGAGTNQYMRKYTCRGCGFSCSERW
ncbi:hypothetical protein D9619_013395 [Psilocybe cf. subviscida]|uniref:Uncharacterized protein n=1 Tax=Psilocybe cf. subviscida TaxID=2480587 RepID=A0A8H5BTD4_9AGAR|nr:hypothetical protein D9619_013395 [Psilocybe cf. subviscida]